jgi:hypothetical protein
VVDRGAPLVHDRVAGGVGLGGAPVPEDGQEGGVRDYNESTTEVNE